MYILVDLLFLFGSLDGIALAALEAERRGLPPGRIRRPSCAVIRRAITAGHPPSFPPSQVGNIVATQRRKALEAILQHAV